MNKMTKYSNTIVLILLINILLLVKGFIFAQNQIPVELIGTCGCCDDLLPVDAVESDCSHHSSLYSNNDLWLPSVNDEIKYVRVNFVFIHKQNDGLGNFVSGNQEHEAIINDLVSQINTVYSHLSNPNDPDCHINEGFISDTRIQIIPNVLHYTNPYYWNNENEPDNCPNSWNGQWLDILDLQIVNDPSIEKGINIYFTENATEFNNLVVNQSTQDPPATIVGCSYFPSLNDYSRSSKIHMPGVFSKYYWMKNYAPNVYSEPWDPVIRGWFITSIGNQIAHELGHSFNLTHVSSCNYNLMSKYPPNGLFHAFLTPSEIGEIHRYLSISSIRKYTTDNSYLSIPYSITSDTEWDLNFTSYRNVIIEAGATLTITCKLVMKSNARIIIKPGGNLIVDGGIITTEDSSMWQGIEVWGNQNANQYAVNGSYGQGYVELKNGATIENAVCALALWRPDHWSTTGGIVHAEDAVFRNNQRSVHALHYKNTSPVNGKQTDYNSWFKRCQFIVNENYLGDEDHVFHKHVDLDHVRGIKFFACDFSVSAPSSNISYWTSGIAGYEAGFSVSGMCSNNSIYPCPSYNNSTFSGFLSAISAVNDGTRTPPTITVTRSSFNNNDFGIYISNLSNTSVRFCDFNVKRQDNWLCGAGIFLENVLNYSVEENALAKTNTFNGEGYGIVIKNCAVQSKVYRNQFEDLYCGNLAWGRNILMKSSNNYIGLEYGCNTNTGNTFDFYVLGDEGVFSGLQSSQGSSLAAARNTFSDNGYHFYNGGDHRITYYYYNVAGFEDEKPLSYNEDKVQIDSTNLTDNCPSNFGNGEDPVSLVLTPAEKYQREQDYYEAYTAYNGLKAVYDSRIDGGNTNNMLYDIASATPSDMWALRAQLLGASPYLSGEVLTDVSDRDDVFTESVLFEILLSNPDELKKDSLMYHLRNKTNPLPQYMMNILDQVANGTTARTVMQNRMAAYRGEYTRAAGDIIRSLVNDTVLDITELRGWLANMKDFYADRDIIATYVDEGDFTNALTLANMLPSLYGLTGNDLVEHNDYVELLELYRDLYNDDRNIMQLDSAERVQVERIAFQGSGYPQAMAQAVLYGTNWESYAENPFDCPTLTLPQGGQRGGHTFTQEDLGRALGLNVSVKPNPATTWTAVDYTLPAKLSKATMTVSNALGVTVMSTELNGNQGQKVLDLRGLADGVYLYTIRCGEYLQTGKLVIAK